MVNYKSYNNTNEDKPQVRNKLRIVLLTTLVVVISGSIITNCIQQISWLMAAESKNKAQSEEIKTLNEQKTLLEQKIRWATSSAYITSQAHDQLLWGKDNDYLLLLPEEHDFSNLYPQDQRPVTNTEPNWQKWLDLFIEKK